MIWQALYDLPCGCKRTPAPSAVGNVLIQRADDECPAHAAEHNEINPMLAQMAENKLIAEELQVMARERLIAKGLING